jgi:hypothetical protein
LKPASTIPNHRSLVRQPGDSRKEGWRKLMRQIAVTALADGWKLSIDGVVNDMVFQSGREAEQAARRLAERLARCGEWSEVRLHLKDGTLAGRFVSPALSRSGSSPPHQPGVPGSPGLRPRPDRLTA